jgi:ketosteroid isomerase-like protein
MIRNHVLEVDRRSVEEWFVRWAELVANVDIKRVREIFVEDAVAFGSKVEMVRTRDELEAEQWRLVWPTMADYRYDLSTLEVIMSPDRLMAIGVAIFRSTGFHQNGTPFDRPGRVTASLMRARPGAPWFATHTHVSLKPGTPAPSYGNRPEAA